MTNASGDVYVHPRIHNPQDTAEKLIEWVINEIDNSVGRQIMLKTLDPYFLMQNNSSWADGSTGHTISGESIKKILENLFESTIR